MLSIPPTPIPNTVYDTDFTGPQSFLVTEAHNGGFLVVKNNPIWVRYNIGPSGQRYFSDEHFVPPAVIPIKASSPVWGIQVRNDNINNTPPPTIAGVFTTPTEPDVSGIIPDEGALLGNYFSREIVKLADVAVSFNQALNTLPQTLFWTIGNFRWVFIRFFSNNAINCNLVVGFTQVGGGNSLGQKAFLVRGNDTADWILPAGGTIVQVNGQAQAAGLTGQLVVYASNNPRVLMGYGNTAGTELLAHGQGVAIASNGTFDVPIPAYTGPATVVCNSTGTGIAVRGIGFARDGITITNRWYFQNTTSNADTWTNQIHVPADSINIIRVGNLNAAAQTIDCWITAEGYSGNAG